MNTTLRVKFSYCKDGDFGIMPTSEVKFFDAEEFGEKKIIKFKDLEKKQNDNGDYGRFSRRKNGARFFG